MRFDAYLSQLSHQHPAADIDRGAGHVAGSRGSQEDDHVGDLLRGGDASQRNAGEYLASLAFSASAVISVRIMPGATALTAMPCLATSRASDTVNETIPPLLASYGAWPVVEPRKAAVEETLTICTPQRNQPRLCR